MIVRAIITSTRYAHLAADTVAAASDVVGAALAAAIERPPTPAADVKLRRSRR